MFGPIRSPADIFSIHCPCIILSDLNGGSHCPCVSLSALNGGSHYPRVILSALDGESHYPYVILSAHRRRIKLPGGQMIIKPSNLCPTTGYLPSQELKHPGVEDAARIGPLVIHLNSESGSPLKLGHRELATAVPPPGSGPGTVLASSSEARRVLPDMFT